MFCLNCSEELKSQWAKKFCNRSCAASYNNQLDPNRKKRDRYCQECSRLIIHRHDMARKAYCNRKLCDECYLDQKYLKKNWNTQRIKQEQRTVAELKLNDGKNHRPWTDSVRGMARSWFKTDGKKCKCGYDKHIEICHKKSIASYPDTALVGEINCADNILFLCPNCHWEYDNTSR